MTSLLRSEVANTAGDFIMMAVCRCDCGRTHKVAVGVLGKSSNSCGCYRVEVGQISGAKSATHGMSKTRTYSIWAGMWDRTTNPNSKCYDRYSMFKPAARWLKFENFLADMGECPEGYSIERKDNEEPYSPENCCWIPMPEQARNRSTTVWVLHKGKLLTLKEAAAIAGLPYGAVRTRHYRRWAIEKMLGSEFSWPSAEPVASALT